MDNLMNQQQQLHRDKRILEQQMNVSINYKNGKYMQNEETAGE